MTHSPTASFSIISLAREDVCPNARTFSFSFCLFCLYLLIFLFYFHPNSNLITLWLSCACFPAVCSGCWPIQTHFGFLLPFPADAKMAATDQPKKSAKIVWRTCMLCSTRLSELCYDTHTKCEACRGQVCSLDSFCNECEGWSAEFRKLYLRHKHSLFTKCVSKKNRKEGKSKDKSPPPPLNVDPPHSGGWQPPLPSPSFDDAASTASQESHVTSPVVMMPLNQDLIDANLTVEQTFQHVDNVVEVQLQPCPVPPQSTTVVDTSFSERVNNMMNTFDNLIPLLTKLGSDRRSPTAGPSESVSPNPLARVPDSAPQVPVVAPQSPVLAPGPSSASSEPRASTSGLQDDFASPRGRSGERDRSRGSRHASPSLQDHLRRQIDDVHRQLVNAKEIVDLCNAQGRVPPDQARYDLEFLQDRYAQLHVAYEESLASTSFHSHGPSPSPHVVASPGVAHIAPTSGSSGLDRPRSP